MQTARRGEAVHGLRPDIQDLQSRSGTGSPATPLPLDSLNDGAEFGEFLNSVKIRDARCRMIRHRSHQKNRRRGCDWKTQNRGRGSKTHCRDSDGS